MSCGMSPLLRYMETSTLNKSSQFGDEAEAELRAQQPVAH
jgi:hypothetical protein